MKKNINNLNVTAYALIAVLFLFFSNPSFSQEWLLGGNIGVGPDAVTAGNNFIGTNIALPLNIRTGGVAPGNTRMFIADGGTGFANGFIGIGNGFVAPQNRLHLHQGVSSPSSPFFHVYTQWTNDGSGGATASDGLLVGLSAAGNAQIIQQENILV